MRTMLALLLVAVAAPAAAENAPQVTLETNHGVIVLELDAANAPKTTANFLEYVRSGFYDGTIFHRVIDGFMIQGGGFTEDLVQKETRLPIENESDNGLSNVRGTVAMARKPDPHSATAQFYINTVDNSGSLDYASSWGYAVFGRVVKGMDVVDSISKVRTGTRPDGRPDVPVEPVVIVEASAN